MHYSLKTRLAKLEKDYQPPKPSAVAIWYEDESHEEAVQRFRAETGHAPAIVIHYWRKRLPEGQLPHKAETTLNKIVLR